MTPGRTLRVLAAAALVAGGWTLLQPGQRSEALAGLETGSWWQGGQVGQSTPQVDQGGLWVSGTPAQQNAISAVRFQLDELESNALLTLKIKSETATPSPGISACAATSAWTANTSPQAWIERPAFSCEELRVDGQRSLDGTTMLFDLGAAGRFVDVVFVPSPGAGPVPGASTPSPVPPAPALPVAADPAYDVVFGPVDPSAVNSRSTVEDDEVTDFGTSFEMPPFEVPFDVGGFGFEPALPPPLEPAAAAPPVTAGPRTAPLRPAAARAPGRSDRIVAAAAFCLLALWWYRLSYAPAAPAGGPRARLTLHDDPRYVPQDGTRLGGRREGRVPSLR